MHLRMILKWHVIECNEYTIKDENKMRWMQLIMTLLIWSLMQWTYNDVQLIVQLMWMR